MTKTKWLIYTVLIGLIPFIIRFIIYAVTIGIKINYIFNEIDMIAFGLVLNVSNITELDGNNTVSNEWKTTNMGLSVLFLIAFSSFLGVSYISELPGVVMFDKSAIKWLSLIASVGSFLFSFSIFRRFT